MDYGADEVYLDEGGECARVGGGGGDANLGEERHGRWEGAGARLRCGRSHWGGGGEGARVGARTGARRAGRGRPYWAAVGFGDIESANVVGYEQKATGADNNFITVPFATVGYNTADIQSIKISDGGAGGIGWGGETFAIWEGLPTVVEDAGFFYCDPSMDTSGETKDYYWGDAAGNKVAYSVAPGQAVVINCAEGLGVTTSGEVSDAQVKFTTVADNNFTGNPFPVAIDVQSIKISDGGAGGIGWGGETFAIWEGVPTVVADAGFFYCDPSMDTSGEAKDYYWGDAAGNKVSYSIAPGRGVVINCAEGLTVTIDAPYAL